MILGEISPLLVIEEVELSDRGVYYCTATNAQGTATSTEAYVNVISKLPIYGSLYLEHKYKYPVLSLYRCQAISLCLLNFPK